MAYLEVKHLGKSFTSPSGHITQALKDVSFKVDRGEILSVVGHNGAGKTTLFNCIRKVVQWDEGEILIDGESINPKKIKVVSVYQDVCKGVVPTMTPLDNMSLIYSNELSYFWSFPKKRFGKRIESFANGTVLAKRFLSFRNTPVSELSGGQRQQLAIVMAMMRQPNVLLLDEFVASLDREIRDEVLQLTKKWIRQNQITTLMITHDPHLAKTWGDRLLELSDGAVK